MRMKKTVFGHLCLVATVEKFYDIVEHVQNEHVGYKKILTEVWKNGELCMLSYSLASQKFIATSHKTWTLWRWEVNYIAILIIY